MCYKLETAEFTFTLPANTLNSVNTCFRPIVEFCKQLGVNFNDMTFLNQNWAKITIFEDRSGLSTKLVFTLHSLCFVCHNLVCRVNPKNHLRSMSNGKPCFMKLTLAQGNDTSATHQCKKCLAASTIQTKTRLSHYLNFSF